MPTSPNYAPLTSTGIRAIIAMTPEQRADRAAFIAREMAAGRTAPYTLEDELRRAAWRRERGYRDT